MRLAQRLSIGRVKRTWLRRILLCTAGVPLTALWAIVILLSAAWDIGVGLFIGLATAGSFAAGEFAGVARTLAGTWRG